MDASQFQHLAKAAYERVFAAFDEVDPDLAEVDQAADNIKITFANGVQFILNRQSATQQLWLATKKRGYHFNFNETQQAWICDHTGRELFSLLQDEAAEQMGQKINL